MTKRIAAVFLWFCAGWTLGAFLAFVLGLSPALGPILGTAAAGLFAGDPRGIIWSARTRATIKRVDEIAASRSSTEHFGTTRTAA